jgi:hypothetical protein
MNHAAPAPLIPEEEVRIAEARLAEIDGNGLGHSLDTVRDWAKTRSQNPAARCPKPAALR